MNQSSQHLEDIKVIKKIMEESSRFLSLSGLSGVFMGLFAIAGAIAAKMIIADGDISGHEYTGSYMADPEGKRIVWLLLADAVVVLFLALVAAVLFSYRKAAKSGHSIWTPVSRRLLLNLFIPLLTGGLFILFTLGRIPATVSVATTLIFYGLALVNAGKFTFGEIYWLGVLEVATGLICLLFPGYTILIWAFGFGVLHITYGFYMHFKYMG
ncbi:MAG TPA: hypothetical protein VLQ76_06850 [Bacteroidales bacterium]|nr:hypothetical protein [Bacteroidales bacterium]